MAEEMVVTNLSVELSRYQRSMQTAAKLAQSFDRQMLNAIGTLNRFEKAANGLKAIKLEADTSTLDRAESDIKALDGMSANVNIDVDADQLSRAEGVVRALDGMTPEIVVTADTSSAETSIKAVDDHLPSSLSVTVTADTSSAESDIKSVDDNLPSPTVRVDADVSGVEEKLRGLQALATLQIGIALAPGAADLLGKVTGVSGQQDTQVARSAFETGTGGAEIDPETIDRLYAATGVAREEIAKAAAEVYNLTGSYETLEADTLSAFGVALGSGSEVSAVIKAQSQLVRNDLVPNFQTAGNVLATGFNNNADRAGDFLDTIIEYAPNFKAMGLDGGQALSGIIQSLEAGTFNADKFGDVVKETGILIGDALSDPDGTKFGILKDLDLVDEAELLNQGKIGFDEFFAGFKEASAGLSPADRNLAITELFGTPAEDLGFDIFANLDLAEPFEVADDAAVTMLDTVQDNLPAAFAELGRTFETEVINKILPMQDILDDVTEKINTITELLRGGMALPDALEIALSAPGLADTVNQFASTANNLILEFLLGVSNILEGIGQQGAADSVRGYVADAAAGQLTFDLKLADDAREALDALNTAERRGVDPAIIEQMANLSSVELVAEGQIQEAQELVTALNEIPQGTITITAAVPDEESLSGLTFKDVVLPLDIDEDATQEEIDKAVDAARQAFLEANPGSSFRFGESGSIAFNDLIDTGGAQATIDKAVEDLRMQFETAMDGQDWVGAFEIATKLNDPALIEEARTAAQNTVSSLVDLFNPFGDGTNGGGAAGSQTSSGDSGRSLVDTQTIISDTTKEVDLFADALTGNATPAVDDTTGALEDIKTPLTDTQIGFEDLTDAIKDTDLYTSIFNQTVDTQMSTAATNLQTYGLLMVEEFDKIRDAAAEANSEIAGLIIPGGGGRGGASAETNAGGGTIPAGGLSLVGEQGIELIGAGTALSVLNNRTTEAFLAGLSMGGGGGSTSTTTINLNVINNNQGMAARGGADTRIANMVRGFS